MRAPTGARSSMRRVNESTSGATHILILNKRRRQDRSFRSADNDVFFCVPCVCVGRSGVQSFFRVPIYCHELRAEFGADPFGAFASSIHGRCSLQAQSQGFPSTAAVASGGVARARDWAFNLLLGALMTRLGALATFPYLPPFCLTPHSPALIAVIQTESLASSCWCSSHPLRVPIAFRPMIALSYRLARTRLPFIVTQTDLREGT